MKTLKILSIIFLFALGLNYQVNAQGRTPHAAPKYTAGVNDTSFYSIWNPDTRQWNIIPGPEYIGFNDAIATTTTVGSLATDSSPDTILTVSGSKVKKLPTSSLGTDSSPDTLVTIGGGLLKRLPTTSLGVDAAADTLLSVSGGVIKKATAVTITTVPKIYTAAGDTTGVAPSKIGDIFVNTSGSKVYVAKSAARGGWVILN